MTQGYARVNGRSHRQRNTAKLRCQGSGTQEAQSRNMNTFTVSTDQSDFEVTIASVIPGTRASWHSPGDGMEVELGRFVATCIWQSHGPGYMEDVVTFETFIRELAADRGFSLAEAERYVEDMACERAADWARDRYEDAQEAA